MKTTNTQRRRAQGLREVRGIWAPTKEHATVKAAAVTAHTFDDAMRYRWLTADHGDDETRAKCRELLKRIGVMSYGDACTAIDSAMANEILRMMKRTAAHATLPASDFDPAAAK